MAGYSRIYCIGEHGGLLGGDGINPIHFQILQGEAHRQWLEARYFTREIRPLGMLRVIVPPGPDLSDNLLYACLAFYPDFFKSCESLSQVREAVGDERRIDFHLNGEPDGWAQLCEEARPLFKHLIVYSAELRQVNGVERRMSGWRFCGEDEWRDGDAPTHPEN